MLIAWLAFLLSAMQPQAAETHWYVLETDDGVRIGHAAEDVRALAGGHRELISSHQLAVQERGDPLTRISERSVRREDAAGNVVMLSEEGRTGRQWTRTQTRIAQGQAEITRQTSGSKLRTLTMALPAGTRFDAGEGLLAGWDPAATPRLSFPNLSPGALAVERVELVAAGPRDAQGRLPVLRRRYEGSALRGVARLLVGADGRIVETRQPLFGATLVVRPADRATALQPHAPYRVLDRALMRSPFRIPPGAMAGRIRYRFGFQDGLAFTLPETAEQRAVADAEGAILDICAGCGPGLPSDTASLAEARRPTAWLQSDSPRVRSLASRAAGGARSDRRQMEALVTAAQSAIRDVDFAGHVSALDALERGTGDCTESAVILAALARSLGIPALVANGLVYSRERYHGRRDVFLPHSWVLAYVDGQWRSYDAALEGFDSTHIALTIGAGDDRSVLAASQLAGLLVWNGLEEVRLRPAP